MRRSHPASWLVVVVTSLLLGGLLGGCDEGDGAVIDQLRQAGADLAKPREVRYYLYLPAVEDAQRVAVVVQAAGRSVMVQPAASGDDWLVLVTETVVVDSETMAARRQEFHAAVDPLGGEYDGWEAAVSP